MAKPASALWTQKMDTAVSCFGQFCLQMTGPKKKTPKKCLDCYTFDTPIYWAQYSAHKRVKMQNDALQICSIIANANRGATAHWCAMKNDPTIIIYDKLSLFIYPCRQPIVTSKKTPQKTHALPLEGRRCNDEPNMDTCRVNGWSGTTCHCEWHPPGKVTG